MSDETKLDLDAIEARANAATRGPWRGDRHDGTAKYSVEGAPSTSGPQALVLRVDHKDGEFGFVGLNGTADEAFVLAARTDVPTLVAEVRRLRDRELQPGTFVRCRCGSAFPPAKRTGMGVDEHTCPGCRRAETAEDRVAALEAALSQRVGGCCTDECEHVAKGGNS